MDADTDPALETTGPGSLTQHELESYGRRDGGGGSFEHGEELISASIDLLSARDHHRSPNDAPDVVQQGGVAVAQAFEKRGGILDVSQ